MKMEIDNKLLESRIIILNDEINENSASEVIKKLLYLDSINNDTIFLYINSPGGIVTQGLAIIDCMEFIKSEVSTLCYGQACSMGAIILAAGSKGKRYALNHADIMIHEVSGGYSGDIDDLTISYNNMNRKRKDIIDILEKSTKKNRREIDKIIKKDYYMSAKEAKEFGIIDAIVFPSN